MLLKQSTARNLSVFMTDSTDHVTGKTGLTLTITASKDGGAFASITPTVTELATGWYKIALTSSHTDTLGDLALHITATGADPTDLTRQIVALLPGEAVALQADQAVNVTKVNGTAQTAADLGANSASIKAQTDRLGFTPAVTTTLGETAPLGSSTHDEGFIVAARKITVPSGGATIRSLATIIGTAAGNGRLALYDASNGGKPGSLIVQTASTALVTGTNTWPVTPTVVPAGDYWIAYQFDNAGYSSTQHTGGPSGDSWYVTSSYVTFPATFNASPTGDTVYYAVSANFTTERVSSQVGSYQTGMQPPTAIENADALLKRDWTSVSGEAARSVLNALRFLRNKWTLAASTLSVKKEDDTTEAWNATTTNSAGADPVTGVDPA